MVRTFVLVVALLGSGRTGLARLGETQAQIEQRYGQKVPPQPVVADVVCQAFPWATSFQPLPIDGMDLSRLSYAKYEHAGIKITVVYMDSKSVSESYQKSRFSDDEVHVLLDANSGGEKWRPVDTQYAITGYVIPNTAGAAEGMLTGGRVERWIRLPGHAPLFGHVLNETDEEFLTVSTYDANSFVTKVFADSFEKGKKDQLDAVKEALKDF